MPSSKRRRPSPPRPAAGSPAREAADRPPSPPPPAAEPDLSDEDGSTEGPDLARAGRLAPAAGIVYALLAFLGSSLLPIGRAEPEDEAAAVARQFTEVRGRVSAGVLLMLFSLFFLLVFVAWLHRWLREIEGRGGWLATLALIGGVLMVATMSLVMLLSIAGTVLDDYGADPVIARTLLVLQWQAVAVSFVPTAAFIGATSLVGQAAQVLPKWLTYSGVAIAIGLLIPPVAFLPFLLSTLWTGMLAVLLLQRIRMGWA